MSRGGFEADIEKLLEPVIDGQLNPCHGDGYYCVSLNKKYGKERVDKGILEYYRRRSNNAYF